MKDFTPFLTFILLKQVLFLKKKTHLAWYLTEIGIGTITY